MTIREFTNDVNRYAAAGIPFFFLADFELVKPFVCRLDETKAKNIYYDVKGRSNFVTSKHLNVLYEFEKFPVPPEKYLQSFGEVKQHINRGDTYLLNLTFATKIETNLTLEDLFYMSKAPYKLFFQNEFIVFSPECFLRIMENEISTYPMKGTIDASLPDAESRLLSSNKELYEHNTIVDLLRNDLSIVAGNVEVTKFRFIDRIITNERDLLQVSSEIRGRLIDNWRENLAEILLNMLPAGSISGAPKKKTVEIIRSVEKKDRGYFTGIFGIYDGLELDSAVNIRYVEKSGDGLQYRSGGGITSLSIPESEYNEMIDKVYVPAG